MCGISGLALRGGRVPDKDLLEKMAASMNHRGPDARGTFQQGPVGLGHARLRVIDISEAADQPFVSAEGQLAIAYNGEVYNYRELRTQLISEGVRFRTASDTEVVLMAYARWGTASFARLNGMFAFAILDWRQGPADPELLLVRDRFGIKPLFYTDLSEGLAFGSELKPFFEIPWISRVTSPSELYSFLKFSHFASPASALAQVRQLSPAHFLRWKSGKTEISRYWRRPTGSPSTRTGDWEEWDERFRTIFAGVIQRQMVSDVPVGTFLSGGIDSSLITLEAVRAHSGINTFTIGYAEKAYDELPHARILADHARTSHHELRARPEDFLELVREVPVHFDQPLGDPTLLSGLLLSRFARRQVTVALSGDGGDELFFGYPYQRALLNLGPAAGVWPSGRQRLAGFLRNRLTGTKLRSVQRATKALDVLQFRDEAELFQYFIGTFGPLTHEGVRELLAPDLQPGVQVYPTAYAAWLPELAELDWPEKIEEVFIRTFLPDTVLAKTDRCGMAYGLETRVPFLDNAMVDFSAALPWKFKRPRRQSKPLLRRILAARAPSPLARRKKQGFSIPLTDWFRGPLRPLLEEYLDPIRLQREGFLNGPAVQRLVTAHREDRANHSHLLWSILTFQLWRERYRISR